MKKTLTVNLGGTVFHIDEDAYRLLDNYLSNLKLHFRKQEGADEIINDIENRISELFGEKVNNGIQVITIIHVEEVIKRMGYPEELAGENEGNKNSKTTRQRLYRDPDNKMLGGVISGLAAYLNWDITLLRLIFIVILFISFGTSTLVYIICWLIIPEAKTAAEKLNMHGEEVTIENIGRTVTDGFEKVTQGVNNYMRSGKSRTLLQKLADFTVTVVGLCLKVCLILFAIICSPALFALIVVLIALTIAAVAVAVGGGAWLYQMLPSVDWSLFPASPLLTVVAGMASVILVGVPLISILHAVLKQVFNWQPMSAGLKWTLFVLWIVGLVISSICFWEMRHELPYWKDGLMIRI
jgi:phage shock protein PspC (stress-responsive transcriptional regulator)